MRRLAILDLGGGDQPIFNENGTVGVLFNGEIYNFEELRARCEARGHVFRTGADTEVLVHLYEDHGPDFVQRLNGMFAFVIWDASRREALLARDRFGVKPLHYVATSDGVAFASETKALVAAGWLRPEVNRGALGAFMQFGWVPDNASMWRNVLRLGPGQTMTIRDGAPSAPIRYHRHQIGGHVPTSQEEVDDRVNELFDQAVRRQLVADVPVGLFLSGGIDSSLIAESVVRHSGRRIPCHTIDFDDADSNDLGESDISFAKVVADRLGLDLQIHRIRPEAMTLLPQMMRAMDEPAGDPAIINSYLMAKAARATAKVLLAGMGADEIAGGYRRHFAAQALLPFFALPNWLRTYLAQAGHRASRSLQFGGFRGYSFIRRVRKVMDSIPSDMARLGPAFASWLTPELMSGLGVDAPQLDALSYLSGVSIFGRPGPLNNVLAFDVANYLPSHNLFYTDKATMLASVEVRVPYLDNDLATYLLSLPPGLKVQGRSTKLPLRRVAARRLPSAIATRKKTGFGAPIRSWLQHDLRPMVDDLLSPRAVASRGFFDPAGVAIILDLFRRNVADLAYPVWTLLSLEVWCREVMDKGC